MTNKKIPFNQLMENAKKGIISREIYIEKMLESIANATLYYFADRGIGQSSRSDTIENTISGLKLSKEWVEDRTFKDLALVLYQYYKSGNQEKLNLSLDALLRLSDIAINNFYYKYH